MNRHDDLSLSRTVAWALSLLVLSVGWGFVMHTAMYGSTGGALTDLGVALGMGGSTWAVTAVGAVLAYVIMRQRRKVLWTWTILLLCAFALLGIGAARLVRPEPAMNTATYRAAQRALGGDPGHPDLPREPVARLSLDMLLAEYQANEVLAASRYENAGRLRTSCVLIPGLDGCRFLDIEATVMDIGRDPHGVAYLLLDGRRHRALGVTARFSVENGVTSLLTVHRGQSVTVRCLVFYDRSESVRSTGLRLARCAIVS